MLVRLLLPAFVIAALSCLSGCATVTRVNQQEIVDLTEHPLSKVVCPVKITSLVYLAEEMVETDSAEEATDTSGLSYAQTKIVDFDDYGGRLDPLRKLIIGNADSLVSGAGNL